MYTKIYICIQKYIYVYKNIYICIQKYIYVYKNILYVPMDLKRIVGTAGIRENREQTNDSDILLAASDRLGEFSSAWQAVTGEGYPPYEIKYSHRYLDLHVIMDFHQEKAES